MAKRTRGLVTTAHICAAVILTVAPMSAVQAQTADPVRAGLTRQTSPPPESPFTVRVGDTGGAWQVDGGGRLVWTAAEPMRMEPGSATSQGRTQPAQRRSKGYRGAQRVLAGVALGVLGFFGGGLTGAVIEGADGSGDSPGLAGFAIGAPIGAAVGATIGFLIVR